MATPGYPMGQMPMGGGPHMAGAAPMPGPVRRGTSKAVPVVVSAGLAVGVFCGLLFGVGTGKKEAAAAAAPSGDNVKKEEPGNAAPAGLGATAAKPVTPPPTTPTTPAATGSGSAAVATTTPTTTPTTPTTTVKEDKKVKLTVSIKPEAAASIAKIIVDGAEIKGMSTDIPGDKKQVKVEVKASGYRSVEKKFDPVGDEMTLEIEMSKKPTGGGVRPPKRPDRPPSGGGGLIDI